MGGLFETLSGAKGIRAEGQTAQNFAEFNAEVALQEGEAAQLRAQFDQIQQEKAAQRTKSTLRANLGSALDSTVASDILGEQAEVSELENLLIGFEGETALAQAKTRATGFRFKGKAAKAASKNAARQSNIKFGIQLASLAAGA